MHLTQQEWTEELAAQLEDRPLVTEHRQSPVIVQIVSETTDTVLPITDVCLEDGVIKVRVSA
jgi:hypothetical protein